MGCPVPSQDPPGVTNSQDDSQSSVCGCAGSCDSLQQKDSGDNQQQEKAPRAKSMQSSESPNPLETQVC